MKFKISELTGNFPTIYKHSVLDLSSNLVWTANLALNLLNSFDWKEQTIKTVAGYKEILTEHKKIANNIQPSMTTREQATFGFKRTKSTGNSRNIKRKYINK